MFDFAAPRKVRRVGTRSVGKTPCALEDAVIVCHVSWKSFGIHVPFSIREYASKLDGTLGLSISVAQYIFARKPRSKKYGSILYMCTGCFGYNPPLNQASLESLDGLTRCGRHRGGVVDRVHLGKRLETCLADDGV